MKKNSFLAAILGVVLLLTACSGECKKCRGSKSESPIPLSTVESVKVNFSGTLYLYQDTFQFASVAGPEVAITKINTTVENGVWELYYPRCLTCEDEVEVVLVVPNIKQVELIGTGRIIAEQSFQQNHISIINKGTGTINFVDLKVDSLYTSSEGTGKIQLSGSEARVINSQITGTGDLELNQFPGLNVIAKITGAGNVYTTAIETLNATITGSGNVYYKGSPVIQKEITGSGQVIKN